MLEYLSISPITDRPVINLSVIIRDNRLEDVTKFLLSFLDKSEVLKNMDDDYIISLESLQKINHSVTIKCYNDVLRYFDVDSIEELKPITIFPKTLQSFIYVMQVYILAFKLFNDTYAINEISEVIGGMLEKSDHEVVNELQEWNIQPFEYQYIKDKFNL